MFARVSYGVIFIDRIIKDLIEYLWLYVRGSIHHMKKKIKITIKIFNFPN